MQRKPDTLSGRGRRLSSSPGKVIQQLEREPTVLKRYRLYDCQIPRIILGWVGDNLHPVTGFTEISTIDSRSAKLNRTVALDIPVLDDPF